jgi:UPF0042 nucleotide-binding protein
MTMRLVIVTGLSGSGKSVALHTLEDQGFYCIDNLPLFLLPTLSTELSKSNEERYSLTAVGIDARTPSIDLSDIPRLITPLREFGIETEILFLDASEETLIKRFSETRRKHPLSNGERSLKEAIDLERTLLEPVLSAADLTIDTTHCNVHELRGLIRERVGHHQPGEISLLFQSFGYKHGVPRDADYVYDARCLPNPHWHQGLRPLTGRDKPVQDFLEGDERVQSLKEEIISFLEHWIPCFEEDGRSYLTVAIGCTGGQHRSVYLIEQISAHFEHCGRLVQKRHRELP